MPQVLMTILGFHWNYIDGESHGQEHEQRDENFLLHTGVI